MKVQRGDIVIVDFPYSNPSCHLKSVGRHLSPRWGFRRGSHVFLHTYRPAGAKHNEHYDLYLKVATWVIVTTQGAKYVQPLLCNRTSGISELMTQSLPSLRVVLGGGLEHLPSISLTFPQLKDYKHNFALIPLSSVKT